MASTSEYETTTGYETTTEYTKATTTPAATAASGAGGGAGVAASVAATHFDRPDTPPEVDAGAASKPMRGTFADNGKDLNLRALARKTFSLQDRATIVALADKQAAGEVSRGNWFSVCIIMTNLNGARIAVCWWPACGAFAVDRPSQHSEQQPCSQPAQACTASQDQCIQARYNVIATGTNSTHAVRQPY